MDCSRSGSSAHGILQARYTGMGHHFCPQGDLPNPGMEPSSSASPALAGRFFTTERRVEKALFCQAWCREMSMCQAVSFVLNQILKMHCNDEPMISICSFFCRNCLLVPSGSVKLAPCHFSHCSISQSHSGEDVLLRGKSIGSFTKISKKCILEYLW